MVEIPQYIQTALDTVAKARLTREDIRRTQKPGDPDREVRLDKILAEIDDAMKPVRSAIGAIAWGKADFEDQLRSVSQDLQYERRQLKKMRR